MSVRLATMADFLTERTDRLEPIQANKSGLPRIEKIDFRGNIHLIEDKPTKTNMILVKNGDLVISGINAEKGAVAVYEGSTDALATIHYSSYVYNTDKIDIEYLKWLLRSTYFSNTLLKNIRGGIKTEIKAKKLLKLELSLPDLSTQQQTAKTLSETDEHIQDLKQKNRVEIQKYELLKGSILDKAIHGDFSSVHDGNEAASDLLERLGIKNARPEVTPFDIPDGWEWCTLESLIDENRGLTYGIIKLGTEPKTGVPTLRCSDVKYRYINTDKIRLVDEELSQQYSRTILQGGEILMNIRGTLGGCSIVPPEMEGFNVAREVAVIPVLDGISKEYILNVLTSPYFVSNTMGNLRGTAYKGLNLGILRKFAIPLPPHTEQLKLVEKINHLMKSVDELEAVASSQEKLFIKLSRSIINTQITNSTSLVKAKSVATNPTFNIQQVIASLLSRGFQKGEMAIAKVLYLAQEIYKVPIGIQFTAQNFGPYDSSVKKALTSGLTKNNKFFENKGSKDRPHYTLGVNGLKITKYQLAQDADKALDVLLPKLGNAGASDIERLASVCKLMQDLQSIDNALINDKMAEWKPGKFTQDQVNKSLAFIQSNGWDKVLVLSNEQ
ncbi:MAG: restriction endonuclease subunit S [Candidatus Saccharimonadales bacterium]